MPGAIALEDIRPVPDSGGVEAPTARRRDDGVEASEREERFPIPGEFPREQPDLPWHEPRSAIASMREQAGDALSRLADTVRKADDIQPRRAEIAALMNEHRGHLRHRRLASPEGSLPPRPTDGGAMIRSVMSKSDDLIASYGQKVEDIRKAESIARRTGPLNQIVPALSSLVAYAPAGVVAHVKDDPFAAPTITGTVTNAAPLWIAATQNWTSTPAQDLRDRGGLQTDLAAAGIEGRVFASDYQSEVKDQAKAAISRSKEFVDALKRLANQSGIDDVNALPQADKESLVDFARDAVESRLKLAVMQDNLFDGQIWKKIHADGNSSLGFVRASRSSVNSAAGLLGHLHPWAGIAAQGAVAAGFTAGQLYAGARDERGRAKTTMAAPIVSGLGIVEAGSRDAVRMGKRVEEGDIRRDSPRIYTTYEQGLVEEAKRSLRDPSYQPPDGSHSVDEQLRMIADYRFRELHENDVLPRLLAADDKSLLGRVLDEKSMIYPKIWGKFTLGEYRKNLFQRAGLLYVGGVLGQGLSSWYPSLITAANGGQGKAPYGKSIGAAVGSLAAGLVSARFYPTGVVVKYIQRAISKQGPLERADSPQQSDPGLSRAGEAGGHLARIWNSQFMQLMSAPYRLDVNLRRAVEDAHEKAYGAFEQTRLPALAAYHLLSSLGALDERHRAILEGTGAGMEAPTISALRAGGSPA